ncbi:MAG: ROK family transcriptional regulator [Devosiaceae bacterium]|nr:ROK family transcriptional regulator [Devosiaceae bacterium MH13]
MDWPVNSAAERQNYPQNAVTPSGVRNHNERLVLSVVKREGHVASSQIARLTSLSAQTASTITRSLEADGMLLRGAPQKGKVGKPSVPVALNPEGAMAFGLRVGRRGADLVLINLVGSIVARREVQYAYPLPHALEDFVEAAMGAIIDDLPKRLASRIQGIGVATPFGLWHKPEAAGAPPGGMDAWRGYEFARGFFRFTSLPVLVANDATMGCGGERMFGAGRTLSDFLYFYVGAFVGGGLALGGRVFLGAGGNAAAVGSILVRAGDEQPNQLVHTASIYLLERQISARSGADVKLRPDSPEWTLDDPLIDQWVSETAKALASAAVSSAALVDVRAVIIDGAFPDGIKTAIRERMAQAIDQIDLLELSAISVFGGELGRDAAAMGAAYEPILAAHFLEGSQFGGAKGAAADTI